MGDLIDRSLRPSFRSAISRAERQVGYREMLQRSDTLMHRRDMEIIHEMCAIMAEVYMMSSDKQIRISGEWLEVELVQQVFGELTEEHVQMVLSEFKRMTEDIRNKKAYIRTSLYNSVFSIAAHYENRVNYDLKGR